MTMQTRKRSNHAMERIGSFYGLNVSIHGRIAEHKVRDSKSISMFKLQDVEQKHFRLVLRGIDFLIQSVHGNCFKFRINISSKRVSPWNFVWKSQATRQAKVRRLLVQQL